MPQTNIHTRVNNNVIITREICRDFKKDFFKKCKVNTFWDILKVLILLIASSQFLLTLPQLLKTGLFTILASGVQVIGAKEGSYLSCVYMSPMINYACDHCHQMRTFLQTFHKTLQLFTTLKENSQQKEEQYHDFLHTISSFNPYTSTHKSSVWIILLKCNICLCCIPVSLPTQTLSSSSQKLRENNK